MSRTNRITLRSLIPVGYVEAKAPKKNLYSILANAVGASNSCIRVVSWSGYRIHRRNTANSARRLFTLPSSTPQTCQVRSLFQYFSGKLLCIHGRVWSLHLVFFSSSSFGQLGSPGACGLYGGAFSGSGTARGLTGAREDFWMNL